MQFLHARDFNLTRETVLGSASTPPPCLHIQQIRGTGLEAVIPWLTRSPSQIESGIAGGVDSRFDAPLAVSDSSPDSA